MNIQELSNMFLNQYYSNMQNNRAALLGFYTEDSHMTYTGTQYTGIKEIKNKIESFSFQSIKFENMNSDCQAGPIPGSLMVFVTGYLEMDGNSGEQFRFSQAFNLVPNNSGGFYVHNDIFSIIM